jgi:murein DD-endopeptidase MepM/ murein hydrolase activator NlpD
MKYIFWSLLLPAIISCALATNPVQKEIIIRPGEVRWLEFDILNENVSFFCRDKKQKIQRKDNKGQAVIIANYFSDLSPFTCQLKDKDQVLTEFFFNVETREYKAEKLRVDPKKIKLSPKDQKRADAEQVILNKIYSSSPDYIFFKTPFKEPSTNVVTSVYGIKRVYNKQKKGQHLGIDYRAAIGDNIPSTNAGKVVFADDLFYTGWTVIIDHGLDIFSVYGHLSKTLVKAGDFIERGQLLGLSGNTGRTSGPHLHWGVKVQGDYIDGFSMIEESKKVFKD